MLDAKLEAWLLDTRRAAHRIVLVELDHAQGTVRLASDDWMSDAAHGHYAYDGWLTDELVIEDALDDFTSVGDVTALNAAGDIDWPSLQIRGYPARFLFGDRDWPHSEFFTLATAVTDECRAVNGALCRFDLSSSGAIFNRRPAGADETRSGDARNVIEGLVSDVGGIAPSFINLSTDRLGWSVSIELTDQTTLGSALQTIVTSIGAHVRITPLGHVQVFAPDPSDPITVTRDDIVEGGVVTQETEPAYARIVLEHEVDQSIERSTGANTGSYDQTLTIATALTSAANAATRANEAQADAASAHPVRELTMLDIATGVQTGSILDVSHDDYTGTGLVTHIRRELLSPFAYVEIRT